MAYNRVVLLGNLTRDPETRMAGSGSVTSFSIAVNDTWTDKSGQRQERVNFIECEAWAQRGETIAKYFTKGRQILVEGSLRQDTWDDKETGKKRSSIRVNVDAFSFVNDGKGSNAGSSVPISSAPSVSDEAVTDVPEGEVDLSEIPF
jgi:single stranded DNA-binding protein (ssb)